MFADYTAGEDFHLALKHIYVNSYNMSCQVPCIKTCILTNNQIMQYEFLPQNEQIALQNEKSHTSNDVASLALIDDMVMSARCFEHNNIYILSLVLKPFFLKSEKDDYVSNIAKSLSEKTQKDVMITLDIDIFCKIHDNMSEDEKELLYEKITQRA